MKVTFPNYKIHNEEIMNIVDDNFIFTKNSTEYRINKLKIKINELNKQLQKAYLKLYILEGDSHSK